MNDIQRFFAWFEGFVENIPGEPTKEQWDKVVSRINGLKDIDLAAAAMTAQGAQTPRPAEPLAKPTTTTQWMSQFKGVLIEKGLDGDSANEIASTVTPDLNVRPIDAARPVLNEMGIAA